MFVVEDGHIVLPRTIGSRGVHVVVLGLLVLGLLETVYIRPSSSLAADKGGVDGLFLGLRLLGLGS